MQVIPIIKITESDAVNEVGDVLLDVAEVGLDQLIDEGIFREIPLLGSAVGVVKIYVKAKDWLLLRNLFRFLYHLQKIPEKKKQEFIHKLSTDKQYRDRVGENLLLLLNRVEDIRKPQLLANSFRAYVEGRINDETYQKLGAAIDRIKVHNIPHLIKFYEGFDGSDVDVLHKRILEMDDDVLQDLVICGLIDMRINPNLLISGNFESNKVTELGRMFVDIVLDNH